MNYTLKEANKIRVGDTLTLEDGSVHEAVEDIKPDCKNCSISSYEMENCYDDCKSCFQCGGRFYFKQIKP